MRISRYLHTLSRQKSIPSQKNLYSKHIHRVISNGVALIGVPMSCGQPLQGTENGVNIVRERGLFGMISELGYKVEDTGDLNIIGTQEDDLISYSKCDRIIKNAWSVSQVNYDIFKRSCALHKKDQMPIVIGGDHSIAIGSVAAALHKDPDVGVLWIDAHADIHTPESSPSMNMHGMPLSFLMNITDTRKIKGFEWLYDYNVPTLLSEKLVYIGLRDVDKEERVILKNMGITAFTMHEIDKFGIAKVMELALSQLCHSPNINLHVSFDIDAVCPTVAPATGTAVPGGLSFREANYITECVAETGALRSLDMVEVNPNLNKVNGDAIRTADMANMLIASLLGDTIL